MSTWEQPANWKDAVRRNYPFKCDRLEFRKFKEYLIARRLDKDTREGHVLAMSRFVNMFEPCDPSEKLDVDNILLNVHHCDLFQKLRLLPLCESDYSCTLALTTALAHYAVMSVQVSYKTDDKARATTKRIIEDVITPWNQICNKVRSEAEARKYNKDAELLSDYHSRDDLKAISKQCYLTLQTIHHNVCKGDVKPTKELLFKATAYFVTVLFTNSAPNRSKEVQTLDTATVPLLSFMELHISIRST